MKAICDLTAEEYQQQTSTQMFLHDKLAGTTSKDWFDNFRRCSGYAHYTFEGLVSSKLVELLGRMPTTNEIIILVDSGFSHFGATCNLHTNGRFSGRVSTD